MNNSRLNMKKGLSNIIATVLIVLLALAAVAIVWGFVYPALVNSGGAIATQNKCLLAEAIPTSCVYNADGSADVNVKNAKGLVENSDSISVILVNAAQETKVKSVKAPGELSSIPVNFAISEVGTAFGARKLRAAASIVDDKDPTKTTPCTESATEVTCTYCGDGIKNGAETCDDTSATGQDDGCTPAMPTCPADCLAAACTAGS